MRYKKNLFPIEKSCYWTEIVRKFEIDNLNSIGISVELDFDSSYGNILKGSGSSVSFTWETILEHLYR